MMNDTFKVCVRCITFNHSAYILDTFRGFVNQETGFPVIYEILDDASTDGEPEIIKSFLKENFILEDNDVALYEETDDYTMLFAQHKENRNCFFAYYLLKYNHWADLEKRRRREDYLAKWEKSASYIAMCEGDDYWIDIFKLQKQVDILDKNTNCSLVCSRTKRYSQKLGIFLDDNRCYPQSRYADSRDIILKGGLFISLCSVVYRRSIKEDYPDYCRNCFVGDYPLSIMAAMKGQVFYIDEPLSVYRVENPNSWVSKQKETKLSEKRLNSIVSEIQMLKGFQKDYPYYSESFNQRIAFFLWYNFPNWQKDMKGFARFYRVFHDDVKMFSFGKRIKLFMKPIYLVIKQVS